MNESNKRYESIQVYVELHNKIAVMAKFNEIKMKILASEIIARMFESHEDEIKKIIKEIKDYERLTSLILYPS